MPLIITDLLRSMDIFEELPVEEIERVATLLTEEKYPPGEVLFSQGDPGDSMFIVTGGRIKLFTFDDTGSEKVLTHFGDGDFFGEMALLTGAPRSASAEAVEDVRVLVLHKDAFDRLVSSNPVVMREMLKVVSKRQSATNVRLAEDEESQRAGVGTGRVYVVYGPRGGSGKTTLAVNLAVALARENPDRVALLDLDLTFGHTAMMLHLSPSTSLADLPPESLRSLDRESLNRYLLAHASTLRVFLGANKPEEGEAVTGEHVKAALEVMKRQFIYIVVDTSSGFSEPILAALEMADKVVLVCTPELNTVRDIRETQRIFADVIHVPREKHVYAMNQYQPFHVLANDQFEQALELQLATDIPHVGEAGLKAAAEGKPIYLAGTGGNVVKAFDKLALALKGEEADGAGRGRKGQRNGRIVFGKKKAPPPKPTPNPSGAPASAEAAPVSTYPVDLYAPNAASRNRLLALVRPVLALPPLTVASVMMFLAVLATIPAWFVILARGKLPEPFFRIISGALRSYANAFAYYSLLADPFPPFSGDASSPRVATYPVKVIIPYPERSSRAELLIRLFGLLPHMLIGTLYSFIFLLVSSVAWIAIIVTGRFPSGLFKLVLGYNRYFLRLAAYSVLVVDRIPPFGIKP